VASPKGEQASAECDETKPARGGSDDSFASLQSSLTDVKEGLERLAKSVGELNSKLQSTGDVLKWVLNALSQRSEEKETLYLKNIQASTELLKSFVDFLELKLGSLGELQAKAKGGKQSKKEMPTKEMHSAIQGIAGVYVQTLDGDKTSRRAGAR